MIVILILIILSASWALDDGPDYRDYKLEK